MAARADLKDAWQSGHQDVLSTADAVDLRTPFDSFIQGVADALDADNEDNRTVLNWVVVARARRKLLGGATSDANRAHQMAIISDVQSLLLEAADVAVSDGLISSAKGTAILDAFNAAW